MSLKQHYQVIFMTDGTLTFMIIYYKLIQWDGNETYQAAFSRPGYNYTTNEVPIQNITTLSNVGVPGMFIYRVDQYFVIMPTSTISGK